LAAALPEVTTSEHLRGEMSVHDVNAHGVGSLAIELRITRFRPDTISAVKGAMRWL
jgi:hypothetical protein